MRLLANQLKHVLRRLLRSPMFTGVTLVTLAIGIGANTAIFSVVNGILLKPLPYPQADRLVGVWLAAPKLGFDALNLSPSNYFVYKDESRTLENMGLWSDGTVSITGLAEPEEVRNLTVTHQLLPALGVPPLIGRWFTENEDSPKGPEAVLLTYPYWQRRFGGDHSVLGRRILIDGVAREIIGVMPEHFRFLDFKPDVILAHRFNRNETFLGNFSYQGIARLKPGATIAQANADVDRMFPIVISRFPPPPGFSVKMFTEAGLQPNVRPLMRDVVGDIGKVLWVLMGTIGIVLLIACANVANLLLVRAEGRQQELAIRAALGASRMQIAREILLESVFLGLLGGALGLALAEVALRVLVAIGPATLPRIESISIDPLVLLFAFGVSLLSGLLFGLIPMVKYAGPRIVPALRAGGRTLSQSRERHRTRNVLVVVQVALAMVLLVSSGLMIRTFRALRLVEPGFTDAEHLQTLRISIPSAQVKEQEAAMRMMQEIIRKLGEIPGVSAVALTNSLPMTGSNSNDVLYAADHSYKEGDLPPIRRFKFVTPGMFRTLGIPLIAGRDYTWSDNYDQHQVVVVSENLAREMWGSPEAAIGKRIREGMKDPWREIIGVVGDVHDDGVHAKAPTIVYWPAMMKDFWDSKVFLQRWMTYVVRSPRAGSESFLGQIRQAVWSVNPNLPLAAVRTMESVYRQSLARTSFALVMLAIAGGMALLLGVVGIYGVISYSVSQRTREIGIRLALGAQQQTLKGMFVRYGLVLSGIGVICGVAAAAALTRLMSSLLFAVKPLDPITYIAVGAGLVAAAVAASYLPARRATRIDPSEALRAE